MSGEIEHDHSVTVSEQMTLVPDGGRFVQSHNQISDNTEGSESRVTLEKVLKWCRKLQQNWLTNKRSWIY